MAATWGDVMDWQEPDGAGECDPDRPQYEGMAEGILSQTPIATPQGWRLATELQQGMEVLTFDHGPRFITWREDLALGPLSPALWPLLVPAWALNNREELLLLPEQRILLEADLAEELYSDPFALIPAQALEGWQGITRVAPPQSGTVVVLGFDAPEILYASRGVLLSCPGLMLPETAAPAVPLLGAAALAEPAQYRIYSLGEAQQLLALICAQEAGQALRAAQRLAARPTVPLPF